MNKKIVNFLKGKNKVNIKVYISEGEKYKISNFFINGNVLHFYKSIKNLININKNELYNQEKITLIVKKYKNFCLITAILILKLLLIQKLILKKKIILNS